MLFASSPLFATSSSSSPPSASATPAASSTATSSPRTFSSTNATTSMSRLRPLRHLRPGPRRRRPLPYLVRHPCLRRPRGPHPERLRCRQSRHLVLRGHPLHPHVLEIMENWWFKKNFRHIRFYIENDKVHSFDDLDAPPPPDETSDSKTEIEASTSSSSSLVDGQWQKLGLPRPMSLNAFDIISFSSGFDLSGLFEERGEATRFLLGEPISQIISKLEEIAKVMRFTVRKKDKIRLGPTFSKRIRA